MGEYATLYGILNNEQSIVKYFKGYKITLEKFGSRWTYSISGKTPSGHNFNKFEETGESTSERALYWAKMAIDGISEFYLSK